jgi:hypothetical protein
MVNFTSILCTLCAAWAMRSLSMMLFNYNVGRLKETKSGKQKEGLCEMFMLLSVMLCCVFALH